MKSLSAWFVDREKAETRIEVSASEKSLLHEQISADLNLLADMLLKSLAIYEVMAAQERQNEALKNWVRAQGGLLKSSIDQQAEKLKSGLVSAVSGAIGPLLKNVVEKKAVDDFCHVLEQVTGKFVLENATITVPEKLHDVLLRVMQEKGLQVKVVPSNCDEISLVSGDTRLETQIGAFSDELNGVLKQ